VVLQYLLYLHLSVLPVDLGYMYVAKGQLQNAEDAVALAAAGSLYPNNTSPPREF
jgi:uncharacterized membrane protein